MAGFVARLRRRWFGGRINATAFVTHFGTRLPGHAFIFKRLGFGGVHPITANRLEFICTSPDIGQRPQHQKRNDDY